MPLYMDIHRGAHAISREELEKAHFGDLEVGQKYGTKYITYWWNQEAGNIFCLVDAPSQEAANAVHREAHGLVADAMITVEPFTVETMMQIREEDLPYAQVVPETTTFDSGVRAIMFTDLAGSTAMLTEMGDAEAHRHHTAHNEILARCLNEHGGRHVKGTGDGILATFNSVARGVECTLAIQRAFAMHNASQEGPLLEVRIGLSAGEPVEDSDDLFGVSVNLAARVCDYADAGRIYTVNVVRELCVGKGFQFEDRGDASLKGFAEPVRIYEIAWHD